MASDRKSVICALRAAIEHNVCADHQFRWDPMPVSCTVPGLLRDCLDLLEEATPRVLSLDEIHNGMALWIELRDVPMWIRKLEYHRNDGVLLAIGGSSAGGARCFIAVFNWAFAVNDTDYNISWRAWTQEPTNEQREAVKWNG